MDHMFEGNEKPFIFDDKITFSIQNNIFVNDL